MWDWVKTNCSLCDPSSEGTCNCGAHQCFFNSSSYKKKEKKTSFCRSEVQLVSGYKNLRIYRGCEPGCGVFSSYYGQSSDLEKTIQKRTRLNSVLWYRKPSLSTLQLHLQMLKKLKMMSLMCPFVLLLVCLFFFSCNHCTRYIIIGLF